MEPDRCVNLGDILRRFREKTYGGLEEAVEEVERVWDETDYPSSEEVESRSDYLK